MFLTTLLLKLYDYQPKFYNISEKNDCHDLGNGVHQSTEHLNQLGWIWGDHFLENKFCMSGHFNDLYKIKMFHPNIKVILIDVEAEDIPTMTNLRFEKTWNPFLRPSEYDKFVKKFNITHWPDKEIVINNPEIIKESFQGYDRQWYQEWLAGIDQTLVDVKIALHSLLAVRGQPLNEILEQSLDVTVDPDTQHFIHKYQIANARYIII